MARERGGRRPGTATGQCRRLYQSICPSSKVQQLDVPDAHICRFSPCGQYLVCFAGGFTQLVVYRFTGPRVSWQGERSDAELATLLASFSCFFTLLYRVQLAPAGEVLARDVVLFMGGGGLLLTASHSPFTAPPAPLPPDADPMLSLPFAESITLHLVRLSDGVRVGGSRLEGELVDLSGRPGSLGVSVHEDLISVLALRSQEVHLLQVLRGGEDVVQVRRLGPHVAEDDELVLQTAAEAEERWLRARKAEREAGGRAPALQCLTPRPPAGVVSTGEDAAPALLPTLRRSYNGDLVRAAELAPGAALQNSGAAAAAAGPSPVAATVTAAAAGMSRHHAAAIRTTGAAVGPGGAAGRPTGWSPPPLPPRYGAVGLGVGATAGAVGRQAGTVTIMEGGVAVGTNGSDAAGGSGGADQLAPPPAAVLYPHRLDLNASGVAGRGARTPEPGDLAAAVAHHAAVRQRARQQQYEQLEAQGGPDHPPSLRRGNLIPGLAGGPAGGLGAAAHTDGLQTRRPPPPPHGAPPPQQPPLHPQGLRGGVPAAHPHHQQHHLPQRHQQQPQQQALPPQQRHARQQQQPPGAHPNAQRHHHLAAYPTLYHQQQHQVQQQQGPGAGRALLPPDTGGGGGGGGCITGIKQRLLAHLFASCLRAHPNNPKRHQREALALFRQLDTFRSLVMRRVYILDRRRLLIDLRKPAAADLGPAALGSGAAAHPGSAPGLPPSQFFLLFDLQTTRVLRFEPSPGDCVIESYIREASSAAEYPWAESLPLWDRYVYDNVLAAARSKLRCGGGGSGGGGAAAGPMFPGSVGAGLHGGPAAEGTGSGAGPPATNTPGAAAERASCAGKLMQLMPPLSGSCGVSSSPYLDASLYNYDERVVSPYIRTRPCLEQPVFFRLRNRPDRAVFRLDPGPYEAMVVRDRRLARSVTHLFHPDAPFVLTVFSVFQQSTLNINFRV